MDIIASLRSRLDIILDEADDDSTTNDMENSPSQKVTQVNFHELRYFLSSRNISVSDSTPTIFYHFIEEP